MIDKVLLDGKVVDLRDYVLSFVDEKAVNFLAQEVHCLNNIFQLNSDVSANALVEVFSPLLLEDNLTISAIIFRISDISTLIRPACIKAYDRYKKRLLGIACPPNISKDSPFYYYYELVTNELYKTQYEILYQEQIQILLHHIFDISLGNGDTYRRYFEKNDQAKLNNLKKEFWNKWKDKATKEQCKEFWEYLLESAGYLFNLSHSISYAMNTYLTAFIKVTPEALQSCALKAYGDDNKKVRLVLNDIKRAGIKLRLPKLNKCFKQATPDLTNHEIFIACNTLNGIGEKTSNLISKRNNFKSLDDFLSYAHANSFNKTVMNTLINIGFFSDYYSDKKEAFDYISNYTIKKREQRDKTYIKKYKDYVYKPKKHEIIVDNEGFNNTCIVEISEKCFDLGEYETVDYKKEFEQFYMELKYLKQPLTPIEHLFDYDLDKDEQLIVIKDCDFKTTVKGLKFTIITDIYNERFALFKEHLKANKGAIYKIRTKTNLRGVSIQDYTFFDFINLEGVNLK